MGKPPKGEFPSRFLGVRGKVQITSQEDIDWLQLMLCANDIGAGGLARLTEVYGSLGEIVRAGRREVAQVIGQDASRVLFSDDKVRECEAACAWLAAGGGADIVVLSDPDYPKRLLQLPRPPAVLFVRGRRGVLSDKAAIFLTGTRRPDDEGRRNAEDFGRAIARRAALLTGFEEGVEMAAAAAALKSEKRDENCTVIGVQATGSDRIFPASARELFYAAAERGLLVSPFVPGVGYASENDVVRRSVSLALSRALFVVQAEAGSAAVALAREAAESARDVYAIPDSIHNALYKGCHKLLREGAGLVERLEDLDISVMEGSDKT